MPIKYVTIDDAPQPAGHYSQGVVSNGLVFVAGQLAVDPRTGQKVLDSIEAQTEQALKNVIAIVEAAGSDISRILKMTIFVADIGLWTAVNSTYAKVMGEHRPARAIVPIGELRDGLLIEIDAIASVEG